MALFRINLFGGLDLRKGEGAVPIPGRNERRLLALLFLHPHRTWSRREVAALVWPEVDFDVSGNRLRTCLVATRKLFEPHAVIHADAHSLSLDTSEVESDLDLARRLRKRVGFSAEPADDAKTLDQLLGILEQELLPDFEDDWVIDARQEWAVKTLDALQKRAELAFQMENYDVAAAASERALLDNPADDLAWGIYLRAMAKRNLGNEAYRRFTAVKKRLAEDNLEISPQLVQLAKSVRDGALAPVKELPALDPEAQDLVLRAFRQMLQLNARDAIRMVTTDSFRLQITRNPAAAVDLLESIIDATEGDDPDRIALHMMALRAHHLLGKEQAVFELSDWILARDATNFQRRATMIMRSFCHFTIREYDQAFRYIEDAIANSEGLSPEQIQIAKAERASYLGHAGRDDEALTEYLATYEVVKDAPEEIVGFAPAAVSYNIGWFRAIRDEFDEARMWLERSTTLSAIRGYGDMLSLAEPALGYVLIRQGAHADGAQTLVSGLTRCYRSNHTRTMEIGLDAAAGSLACLGHTELATGLIDWCVRTRAANRHVHSVFETRFVNKIRGMAGDAAPNQDMASARSTRAVLEQVFAAIGE